MKIKTIALTLAVAAALAGCGGGGCAAGKPAFGNVPYDCADAALPAASAASAIPLR